MQVKQLMIFAILFGIFTFVFFALAYEYHWAFGIVALFLGLVTFYFVEEFYRIRNKHPYLHDVQNQPDKFIPYNGRKL